MCHLPLKIQKSPHGKNFVFLGGFFLFFGGKKWVYFLRGFLVLVSEFLI
jgi:hypothetical protein